MQKTNEKERAFVELPGQWPRWPILPVVKRKGYDCGFLFADGRPIVYVGNIFDINDGKIGTPLSAYPKVEYLDFEGLLDVWRVD